MSSAAEDDIGTSRSKEIKEILGTLVDPAWGDDPAAYLGPVAAVPGRYLLAGALWTIGSLLFIPGARCHEANAGRG